MVLLVTLIVAMACLLLLTDIGRAEVILVALAVSVFAMTIEADSWRGYDNLFLPMGVFLFLVRLLDGGAVAPVELASPVLGMAGFYGLGRLAGLGGQMARIHGVAAFLFLSATALHNAVLPGLLLAGNIALAARGRPTAAETLDRVAALALFSFGFLGLGTALGRNAIDFFLIACAGVGLAHAAHALPRGARGAAATAIAALAAGALALWAAGLNGPNAHWHAPLGPAAAAALAVAGLAPRLVPEAFAGAAGLRLTLLGAGPALALFLGNCLWLVAEGP